MACRNLFHLTIHKELTPTTIFLISVALKNVQRYNLYRRRFEEMDLIIQKILLLTILIICLINISCHPPDDISIVNKSNKEVSGILTSDYVFSGNVPFILSPKECLKIKRFGMVFWDSKVSIEYIDGGNHMQVQYTGQQLFENHHIVTIGKELNE